MARSADSRSRRAEFAEAAWRTIAARGLDAATVRAVARDAGASTGRLVHYFRSKDELMLEALRHAGRVVRERMNEILAEKRGLAALHAVLLDALPLDDVRSKEWRFWLAYWGSAASEPGLAAEQARRLAIWRSMLARILEEARSACELAPGADAALEAEAIMALVDGLGQQALFDPAHTTPERLRAHVDALLARLTAREPR
ncbi:MAG: TetR/AcrR family transcriptional regulator [Myxococcota bacterium]